jgi:hypothetical protein
VRARAESIEATTIDGDASEMPERRMVAPVDEH